MSALKKFKDSMVEGSQWVGEYPWGEIDCRQVYKKNTVGIRFVAEVRGKIIITYMDYPKSKDILINDDGSFTIFLSDNKSEKITYRKWIA